MTVSEYYLYGNSTYYLSDDSPIIICTIRVVLRNYTIHKIVTTYIDIV